MATTEDIRPIYAELQGCLSQAPSLDKYTAIQSQEVWDYVNGTIDQLSRVSGEDFSRFKLTPKRSGKAGFYVAVDHYRTKLGGLILHLYGKYFPLDVPPFSGTPHTLNIQNQQQDQSVHIEMIVDLTEELTRSEARFESGTKERGFIDKVKGYLKSAVSGTTGTVQLLLLLLQTAKECGLSVEDMWRVFKD